MDKYPDAMFFYEIKKMLDESYSGITGVGHGYKITNGAVTDRPAIIVYVEKKVPLSELSYGEALPVAIETMPTDVIEMPMPHALEWTGRFRPVPGGVSAGHRDITAGTNSCTVRDGDTGAPLFLSNCHVYADSNAGQIGDDIYQPGPADGGGPADAVASLHRFVPIEWQTPDIPPIDPPDCQIASSLASLANQLAELAGSKHRLLAYKIQQDDDGPKLNKVDCAVAKPFNDDLVSNEILDIGRVKGSGDPQVGLVVQKSGRTTGYTTGDIQAVNVTISVRYGGLVQIATFIDQVVVQSSVQFSAPGDSGSLVLDMNNNAVGLLFAGSEASTIINPIREVMSALNIGF